jgi:hypothetical protein
MVKNVKRMVEEARKVDGVTSPVKLLPQKVINRDEMIKSAKRMVEEARKVEVKDVSRMK